VPLIARGPAVSWETDAKRSAGTSQSNLRGEAAQIAGEARRPDHTAIRKMRRLAAIS